MPTARIKEAKEKASTPPQSRPLIGVNTDYIAVRNTVPYTRLNAGYIDAIFAAGGMPVLIPPVRKDNLADLDSRLDRLAGIILTGGADMDPRRNGQALTAAVNPMPPRREDADRYLLAKIFERQDDRCSASAWACSNSTSSRAARCTCTCRTTIPKAMPHFDQTGAPHRHMVLIEPNTRLDDIYGTQELRVNSTHHQAVNQIGKRMRVAAKAPDGVIEAIESTDPNWFCVGVQWHPEAETASALDVQIFECFVQAAVRASDGVFAAA